MTSHTTPTRWDWLFHLTQFTGNVYGTDVAGAFQCVPLNKDGLNLVGKSFPEKIMFGAVKLVLSYGQ